LKLKFSAIVTTASIILACAPAPASSIAAQRKPAPVQSYKVVATFPHDTSSFTQGLVFASDGQLYESTGLEGESTIRRVDPKTGRVLKSVPLPAADFGEGIARVPEGLVQLTWQSDIGYLWDPATLARKGALEYKGDGWGLCYDGTSLVMSDGSPTLLFRRRENFEVQRTVRVTLDDAPLKWVNELECVNGSIYGNVWRRDIIVRIDPATGIVREKIDASGLLTRSEAEGVDFLNGIAYDPADGLFYLTGKKWPKLFKVRFVPAGT